MELTALAMFAGALFVNSGSPGPSVAALVARVINDGYRGVLPFLAAMWIGEALWLTLAVAGLGYVAESFYNFFAVLKYCGAAYLLYLAYRMWSAPSGARLGDIPADGGAWRLFLTGMAITLGNPKIMVFYLALLPAIVDVAGVSIAAWAELIAIMLLVLMVTDLIWVAIAAQARGFLHSPRAMRIANRVSATAMGGAAAAIAAR